MTEAASEETEKEMAGEATEVMVEDSTEEKVVQLTCTIAGTHTISRRRSRPYTVREKRLTSDSFISLYGSPSKFCS